MNSLWKNISGHKNSIEQINTALKNSKTPHALLFSGPEGVGKRTIAQALASSLITKNGTLENSEEIINLIKAGNHPDLHFVYKAEDKKDLSVDIIREVCNKIKLKPYYPSCSVAIIDNAQSMNLSAFNALLMTLEEPCNDSYIILISHQAQRIPETILSRCQNVFFSELTQDEITSILNRKLELDSKTIAALLKICSGSLANLELQSFINPTSLKINKDKALLEHLETLVTFSKNIDKEINAFIEKSLTNQAGIQDAIVLATKLKEQENSKLLWQIINNSFREAMLNKNSAHANKLADLILQTIKSEKMVHERNLNQDLHLSSIFLNSVG